MCGIVGMAGKLSFQHKQIFKDLLSVCQVRGRDATGVIRVKPNDEYTWVKNIGTPDFLVDTKMYDKQIDHGDSKVLIGHCRAKTVGENTGKNAHPFDFPGKICGVHNGTLQGIYQMERQRDFTVDSELLYWTASEYGIEETVTKRLDIGGAWALVYWNAEENTLNFLRNDKRPLYFTHSKNKQVMFWASEPWMLSVVSRKIELWDGEDAGSTVYGLPVDQLYSFKIDYSKHKPSDIFLMTSPKELKAEVRGYTGNVHSRGTVGDFRPRQTPIPTVSASVTTNGGEVADPFLLDTDRLDDSLDGIWGHGTLLANTRKEGKVLLPPRRDGTRTQEGSTPTVSSTNNSSTTSRAGSVSLMGSTNMTSSLRQRISLPEGRSKTTLLGPNGEPLNACNVSSMTSSRANKPEKMSSTRQVAGLVYITDNKTSREFAEADFDRETGGCCCFCRSPIGDLSEVQEIFCEPVRKDNEDIMFLCTNCVIPAVA